MGNIFTDDQVKKLQGKLNPKHVSQRDQSGIRLSYIEGWHAIAEANRVFGFDMWMRETVSITCVHETGYVKKGYNGKSDKDMWKVSYIARVRVTVGGVIREGFGAGHGHSTPQNAGDAHESALKEAETDAMKRALMTFGNLFGLALYDKTQANVGVDKKWHGPIQKSKFSDAVIQFNKELDKCTTAEEFQITKNNNKEIWDQIKLDNPKDAKLENPDCTSGQTTGGHINDLHMMFQQQAENQQSQ